MHENPHTPPPQAGFARGVTEQTCPQKPQLFTSVLNDVFEMHLPPPHSVKPALQARPQDPDVHTGEPLGVPPHAFRQKPQLFTSVCNCDGVIQPPEQRLDPGLQSMP